MDLLPSIFSELSRVVSNYVLFRVDKLKITGQISKDHLFQWVCIGIAMDTPLIFFLPQHSLIPKHQQCLFPSIIINIFLKDWVQPWPISHFAGRVAVFNDKLHTSVGSSVTLVVGSFQTLQ